MECIAHRGFAGVQPENTRSAVRRAAAAGADALEIDVRRCASGEVVVCHDETVDRVTDGSGRVADLPFERLAALDVLGTGEGIPGLEELLAAVPGEMGVTVELKESGLSADVLTALAGRPGDWWLAAFDPATIEAVNDVDATAPTALLAAPDQFDHPVDRARELGCRAVHPHHDLCTAALVSTAADAGLAVNAWTVRSRATAQRLAAAGVDGCIADAPAYCVDAATGGE